MTPPRDIRITVGAFGVELRDKTTGDVRGVPILPLIVGEFGQLSLPTGIPRTLEIAWPDLRYSLFEPGRERAPFLGLDEPTSQEAHELFQRLWRHWGYYFVRLVAADGFCDLQVCAGGKVYPLNHRLESAIEDLRYDKEEIARRVLLVTGHPGMSHDIAMDAAGKYERLVGSLPAIGPDERVVHTGIGQLGPQARFVRDAEPGERCRIGGCSRVSIGKYAVYCAEHAGERMEALRKAKVEFVRKLEAGKKPPPPCYVCGKVGPRHRRLVRVDGKERDICMDCCDAVVPIDQQDGTERKPRHDLIVETYLDVLQSFTKDARRSGNDETGQRFRWFYTALREARLYEMPVDSYDRLRELASSYLVSLLGFEQAEWDKWVAAGARDDKVLAKVDVLAKSVPMPAPLPFDTIYIGWGDVHQNDGDVLVGTLISTTGGGRIIEFFGHADQYLTVGVYDAQSDGWGKGALIAPWSYAMLIESLNDYRTICTQQSSLKTRLAFKQAGKGKRQYLPRPYYIVTMQDRILEDAHKSTKAKLSIPREWSHRWDVEGHERLYVRRGPLPIAPRQKAHYLAGGWQVFESPKQMSGEAYAIVLRRGAKPMQMGEWMAVKRTRISSYQKPKDRPELPYVPASRRPSKQAERKSA